MTSNSTHGLKDLWREYRAAWKAMVAAMDRSDAQTLRVRKLYPPRPPELTVEYETANGSRVARAASEEEILRAPVSEPPAHLLRMLYEWEEECRAIDKEHLDPSLAAAEKKALAACRAIERKLLAAPVRTVEDISYKVRFLADISDDRAIVRATRRMVRQIDAGRVTA